MKDTSNIDKNSSSDLLKEIKDIILGGENNKMKNENILFNIKKIDNDNKSNKDNVNINNILNDLTESYKYDNSNINNNPNKSNNINNTNNIINTKNIELTKNKNNYMNIIFYSKKYLIKTHQIVSSNLNMYNLNNSIILKENIINDNKISLVLENKNSSYLLNYFNQTYLFNKVNEKLLITNLKNKKTLVLKTNSFFKFSNNSFYLTNDCSLIMPIMNKKIYDNNIGQSINYFEPVISQ